MTLTLLLDLDDTLLGNEINAFIPIYSKLLAKHLATYVDPELLITNLFKATGVMLANQRPDRTLEETFDSVFYPAIGIEKAKIRPVIDQFYQDIFPSLQSYTQFIPEAVQMVQDAFRHGFRVGIATNPLFPRMAILHRMAWAGLPADQYPFALVPSYETFHFAKPNPAFFAEYLAKLGWPEGPVLMVGDTLDNDITAARQLGLPAFWMPTDHRSPEAGDYGPSGSGVQADLIPWVEAASEGALEPSYANPLAYQAILRSTPAALDSLRREIPFEQWTIRPQPGEWSLVEIVCHLRDVDAEVNLPRLQKMVQESNPFIPGMDTDRWADERNYIAQDPAQALSGFMAARMVVLEILEKLTPEDWKRTARHAILGPSRLEEVVGITASHDRLHIQQVHQVIDQNSTAPAV